MNEKQYNERIMRLQRELAEKDKDIATLMEIAVQYRAIDLCTYEGDSWMGQTNAGTAMWRTQARKEIEKELTVKQAPKEADIIDKFCKDMKEPCGDPNCPVCGKEIDKKPKEK